MTRWRRFWCSLRGHDRQLVVEHNWLVLRCVTCQADTSGWAMTTKAPVPKLPKDGVKPKFLHKKIA